MQKLHQTQEVSEENMMTAGWGTVSGKYLSYSPCPYSFRLVLTASVGNRALSCMNIW